MNFLNNKPTIRNDFLKLLYQRYFKTLNERGVQNLE
jgi:hypothetical protein